MAHHVRSHHNEQDAERTGITVRKARKSSLPTASDGPSKIIAKARQPALVVPCPHISIYQSLETSGYPAQELSFPIGHMPSPPLSLPSQHSSAVELGIVKHEGAQWSATTWDSFHESGGSSVQVITDDELQDLLCSPTGGEHLDRTHILDSFCTQNYFNSEEINVTNAVDVPIPVDAGINFDMAGVGDSGRDTVASFVDEIVAPSSPASKSPIWRYFPPLDL